MKPLLRAGHEQRSVTTTIRCLQPATGEAIRASSAHNYGRPNRVRVGKSLSGERGRESERDREGEMDLGMVATVLPIHIRFRTSVSVSFSLSHSPCLLKPKPPKPPSTPKPLNPKPKPEQSRKTAREPKSTAKHRPHRPEPRTVGACRGTLRTAILVICI